MEKKNVSVVIGLNYGDEGKGLVTDYLVNRAGCSTAVVRFNGGAQAGHTVQLPDGRRHVFHHFGAGTYCGAATILSKHFVINPILFFTEAQDIYRSTVPPKKLPPLNVYVDWHCQITTPYDVYINQLAENTRGDGRHGSCGVGFGETLERQTQGYDLEVADIGSDYFIQKVERIRDEWLPKRLAQLGLPTEHNLSNEVFEAFLFNCNHLLMVVERCTTHDALNKFDNIVFEGAQGLRLDQNSEDFPNVTRSNTGLQNVAELTKSLHCKITVYYVTRAYMTRHGAGKLDNEIPKPINVIDETNVPNDYQGAIRYAILDTASIAKNVQKDKKFLGSKTFSTVGVVTCCDQVDAIGLPETIDSVSWAIGASKMLTSFGPTRQHITESTWTTEDALLC